MKTNLFYIILLLLFFSCKKEQKTASYNNGNITIVTDESFKSVVEALADGYMMNYPETKIKVETKKEDFAFLDLLNNKTKLIVMSRELSAKEKAEYEKQVELKYNPAKYAADAVVFVVPKNFSKNSISIDEINKELSSEDKNIIFDGTNSSNLNFVAQKLNKKPSDLKFSIISGNENVVDQIAKYPNKIGVISLNTISRPYGLEAEKLKSRIKILSITSKDGKIYEPSIENLKSMEYPFTRVLYFLTNEGNFNLANGIIRFSCTQIGQSIVEKEGLQPYNIYKREVQMR